MDEARVVLNVKEGIIELQGPVDFVRRYLDTYQPAIKGLQGLPRDTAMRPRKTRALSRKRKGVAATTEKTVRPSCIGTIRSYLKTGFLDEPRSTSEVRQHLSETGLTCNDNAVRTSLSRLALAGLLNKVREGRSIRYQRRL